MNNEARYKKIFKIFYEFLAKYDDKELEILEQWKQVADDIRSKVDYDDILFTKIALACYLELAVQNGSKAGDYHTKQKMLKSAIIELAKHDDDLWESVKSVLETVNEQMLLADKAVAS